jgi:hypothetical protein
MNLYIQIRNGVPYEHPIFEDNFREAFPHIDTNNLPPEFARFVRVECPNNAGTFEVDEVSYQFIDGVVTDVWSVRQMTAEEKVIKEQHLTTIEINKGKGIKFYAEHQLTLDISQEAKDAWTEYIAVLSNWIETTVDGKNMPSPPKFDQNGNVLTTSMSGSVPDVIG